MCNYIENPDRLQITVRLMHIECWPTKGCNHSFRTCNIIHFILQQ